MHSFYLLQCSEKRIKFEQLILYEKRRMDGFRVKETRDVLTLDELKERVETVDELFDILEVRNKHPPPTYAHSHKPLKYTLSKTSIFIVGRISCNLEFCVSITCFIMIYMTFLFLLYHSICCLFFASRT